MGLRELIRQNVQAGLALTGNIREDATYRAAGTPGYSATTGTVTTGTTNYAIKALFASYAKQEIDGDRIRPEDKKCLVAGVDLAVTPGLNDTVQQGSTVWSVVGVQGIPTDGLWILQLRRP